MSEPSRQLVEICHRVAAKGFVAATDGNISLRLPDGTFLTTPTGLPKGEITESDLVVIDRFANRISGTRAPSTEIKMHLFLYRERPDVHAVVHCHPVYATGFAAAGIPLKENVFPEIIAGVGPIPLAPYATPSTEELGESLRPFVAQARAVLLANHGVVTFAGSLAEAYYLMEKVEQTAQTLFVAEMLGGAKQLSADQAALMKKISATVYGQKK